MTLLDIIQKATEIVTAGLEGTEYPALDAEGLAEAHLETVFAGVARRYAAEGRTGLLARKQKTLAFVSGAVSLTDDVLQSCMEHSTLHDTSDYAKLYAYVPFESDARTTYDRRLGYYWAPAQGSLSIIEPGASTVSLTGSRSLSCLCIWEVPAGLDSEVDVSLEVAADLIAGLADAVRATLPAQQEVAA